MVTVGVDFGTHQTKVCIEAKKGAELRYTFMQFQDPDGNMRFALPSIIGRGKDGCFSYGYLDEEIEYDEVIQYFKQGTFCENAELPFNEAKAMMYSVLYLANLLFDIERTYGESDQFTVQMGVPTDSKNLLEVSHTAKVMMSAAMMMVEDEFHGDKESFLKTNWLDLWDIFMGILQNKEFVERCSQKYYPVLVFPEAYACLKPIVQQGKLTNGISLMMDIGGGTTDMSFFNIEHEKPQVYSFYSVQKGLNYLTAADKEKPSKRYLKRMQKNQGISPDRLSVYTREIGEVCDSFLAKLEATHLAETSLPIEKLKDAIRSRPLVYSGGGSTFSNLRKEYGGFKNTMQVTHSIWKYQSVDDFDRINQEGLCPILSVAYGLAIHVIDDNIPQKPLSDIFENVRKWVGNLGDKPEQGKSFGKALGGFDYGLDYDARK